MDLRGHHPDFRRPCDRRVTLIGDDASKTATVAYVGIAALLLVMAVISLMTAGRNRFIAYRLCAPIFSASAILLLVAAVT